MTGGNLTYASSLVIGHMNKMKSSMSMEPDGTALASMSTKAAFRTSNMLEAGGKMRGVGVGAQPEYLGKIVRCSKLGQQVHVHYFEELDKKRGSLTALSVLETRSYPQGSLR